MLDMDRLADVLVTGAKRYVDDRLRSIDDRLRAIEAREPVGIVGNFKNDAGVLILTLSNGKALETGIRDGRNGTDGKDGKDGKDGQAPDPDAIKSEIDAAFASRAKADDGQRPTDQEIRALILDAVTHAIAEMEPPEPGPPGPPGKNGKDGADGIDGQSVTLDEIKPLLEAAVGERFASIKNGKDGRDGKDGIDGKSVTIADLGPVIEAAVSARMATIADGRDGKDGKDGVGLAGALINRDGELILTLTNGTTISLGRIVGKDGAPGRDGFGLEDLTVTLAEDGRTAILRFARGDLVKEFALPFAVMLDRGVWHEGKYVAGDFVSYRGSGFVAQRETSDVPETSDAWRLAVKRGRDGKDGKLVEPKPQKPLRVGAPNAEPGRNVGDNGASETPPSGG